jgi:cell wall-associated NlpC family hydrolase
MTFRWDDLVGARFCYGGRGPEFDCWGLVREALLRQGQDPPEYPSSDDGSANAATAAIATASPVWERLTEPEVGCVVAFRDDCGLVSHVGVIIEGGRFLHIREATAACAEKLNSPLWRRRIAGFYRLA